MKYASIDIETTGLDAETCQILSIGVVIEDTNKKLSFSEIPKIEIVIPHKEIRGEEFAINMNIGLIKKIEKFNNTKGIFLHENKYTIFLGEEFITQFLSSFFDIQGLPHKITVAGKNFIGFDLKFLSKLPGWDSLNIHRRVIDPASLFVDWENDTELPDLKTCKERAGISGNVTHNAVEDAFDVIEILRTKYK